MVGAVTEVEWDPDSYLELMLAEIPGYEELEETVVAATGAPARDILELGIGTGETARRVLALHPDARLVGIDWSKPMLVRAREVVPAADLRRSKLEDPLPAGPFDLVVSVLAVHHLDGPGKRELFGRVAEVLRPGCRFVLGDVVVPERPHDAVIEIDWVDDLPSSVPEQLEWLDEAGFEATASYVRPDLAVFVATRRSR
jgi:tRNA (cmo5U34)-methyltransferase